MRPFSEEYKIGRASVDFVLVVPSSGADERPRLRWFERLRAFENVESTKAWRGISSQLDAAPHLSQEAREFVLRAVRAEVGNAYEKTVLIKHFVMSLRVSVRVMALAAKVENSDDDDEDEEGKLGFREIEWRPKLRGRQGDSCGLCGDGLPLKELSLGCKHAFHLNCYYKWWERSHKCPACGPQVR